MQPLANQNGRLRDSNIIHKFDPTPKKMIASLQLALEDEMRKPEDKQDESLISELKDILEELR